MSFSDLRFTRIINGREKKVQYESGTTSANRVCELSKKGEKHGDNYLLDQEELNSLIESYGAENFRILLHEKEKKCDEYLIYREETGDWVGILYNEDDTERKPFFIDNTKFRLYHKMMVWLIKRIYELEKENATLKSAKE